MTSTVRRLPAFGGCLLAVASGPEAATLGVITASSHPLKSRAQRLVTRWVGVAGTRGLPRTSLPLDRTFGADAGEMTAMIRAAVPGATLLGVNVPRQADRRRLIALATDQGGRVVIVKVDANHTTVEHEGRVLQALGGRTLAAAITPGFVGAARCPTIQGEVAVVAQSAVTVRPHRPETRLAVDRLADAIAVRLAPLLGDPPAEGWVPQHGDLAPWNLRRTDRGVALVDWETAAYAPAGTDAAYFAACVHALHGTPMPPIRDAAREHLLAMLAERSDAEDVGLTASLRQALRTAPTAP